MTAIYFDPEMDDNSRRNSLYAGNIFVYSPTPSSEKLCAFANELAADAFYPHDPQKAQYSLTVEIHDPSQNPISLSRYI